MFGEAALAVTAAFEKMGVSSERLAALSTEDQLQLVNAVMGHMNGIAVEQATGVQAFTLGSVDAYEKTVKGLMNKIGLGENAGLDFINVVDRSSVETFELLGRLNIQRQAEAAKVRE